MAPSARTLWLLRHAKTLREPPPGGADFDRTLAPRGQRDAEALGRLFSGKAEALGLPKSLALPTVALVSSAARTAATAELVLAGLSNPPDCRLQKTLYGADPDEVIDHLRALEDDVRAAMVVGHNPTAFDLSQGLIADSDKKGLALATRRGFPTCALGIYRFRVERWREVSLKSAKLVELLTPPYGDD